MKNTIEKMIGIAALASIFMLCGCNSQKTDGLSLSPVKSLAEASVIYEKSSATEIRYSHEFKSEDSVSGYYTTVHMDKLSGTSHAEATQSLSNSQTAIYESSADMWMIDTGTGSRHYYMKENNDADWAELDFRVPSSLYSAGDVAGYLLDQNKQGYIAVDSHYKNGVILVTAKVNDPSFMSIEPSAHNETDENGKWDVVLELDGIKKTPMAATFKRNNETVILRYSGFDIDFNPSIPAITIEQPEETEGGE